MSTMLKCRCSAQSSKYCIEKSCKNCCRSISCKRHAPQQCEDCGVEYRADAFKSSRKIGMLSKKCVKCKEKEFLCKICKRRRFDRNCSFRSCRDCCEEEKCKSHLNSNNCCVKCKKMRKICKDNMCVSCFCNNHDCEVHYTICGNCPGKIKKHKCSLCKECCHDFKCGTHFIQDDDVTIRLLNDYKLTLHLSKFLPVEIINKIVDDYLDVISECKFCDTKFSSLNACFESGLAFRCRACAVLICDDCFDESLNICKNCMENMEEYSVSGTESYYDDAHSYHSFSDGDNIYDYLGITNNYDSDYEYIHDSNYEYDD